MRSSYASSHRASQLLVVNSCMCPSHIASQLLDVKSLAYASPHRASHLLDVKSCIGLSHRASQLLDVRSLAYASSHRASHLLDVKFSHMTFSSGSHCPTAPTLFHAGCESSCPSATHHSLLRGTTPSISLKYSNFTLANGLVNTSATCSSVARY